MEKVLLIFHVCLALGLIGLVLIQHGKGADAGAAFGSGASSTVFGARGAASFLTRATGVLAALFFVNSLVLAHLSGTHGPQEGLMERMEKTQAEQPIEKGAAPSSRDVPAPPADSAPADNDVPAVDQ